MGTGAASGILVVLVILGLIVAVLWILLPFVVFGLKDLVRKTVNEQRRTNELLERIAGQRQDPTF